MNRTKTTALLVAACLSVPATAQYGRLVPPEAMLSVFSEACVAGAPRFSQWTPRLAERKRWDALGLSGSARPGDRGWLVSANGQPVIVDIHRPKSGTETCSVSAVTAPQALIAAMTKREGRGPDLDRRTPVQTVKGWTRTIEKRPISVTMPLDGRALARITIAADAR